MQNWDFYTLDSESIVSEQLGDYVNFAVIWSCISIMGGTEFRVEIRKGAYEKFPDKELIDTLYPEFDRFLMEPIVVNHLSD